MEQYIIDLKNKISNCDMPESEKDKLLYFLELQARDIIHISNAKHLDSHQKKYLLQSIF